MGRHVYSTIISDEIAEALDDLGYGYDFNRIKGVFHFSHYVNEVVKNVSCYIIVEKWGFEVRTLVPIQVQTDDARQIRIILEFLSRANLRLSEGSFVLDAKTGHIIFRYSVSCRGNTEPVKPTQEMIYAGFACSFTAVRYYCWGIDAVVRCGASARKALEWCEIPAEDEKTEMEEFEDLQLRNLLLVPNGIGIGLSGEKPKKSEKSQEKEAHMGPSRVQSDIVRIIEKGLKRMYGSAKKGANGSASVKKTNYAEKLEILLRMKYEAQAEE